MTCKPKRKKEVETVAVEIYDGLRPIETGCCNYSFYGIGSELILDEDDE
jgi:hypothetical protein